MMIKTVDLITINEASKALKQKDFIYCDGCIYGIDNINGYMTYTYILDKLHDKYNNFNGFIFNARELSAFVKSIGTEEDFDIIFNIENIAKILSLNGELYIKNNRFLLSMVRSKRIKFGPMAKLATEKLEITNDIRELYDLKKTEGCYYYKPVINNTHYFITLFYGLLPLNKADRVFLSIYDPDYLSNSFIAFFTVIKKKFEVNTILCYLKLLG